MSSANIGWLFYKDYFKDIIYSDLKNLNNEAVVNKKISNIINQLPKIDSQEALGNVQFEATTTYPGLLIGSGNAHELPDIKGQAILGFHFDYTTGLPCLQGSSVKGILRSAFKHRDYIKELLDEKNRAVDIEKLEIEIFGQTNGSTKIVAGKDVFFDANVAKYSKELLGDDFITPHKDPLKNPIPLRFIKVMPNVTFRFDFELHDGLLSRDEKAILFAQILSDLGAGAKTNVGYGHFASNLVEKTKRHLKDFEEAKQKEAEQRKQEEQKAQEEAALDSIDSNVQKIQIKIEKLSDNKEIYDVIAAFELSNDEKNELLMIVEKKIGKKPEPKNNAKVKWAIKIYEFIGK